MNRNLIEAVNKVQSGDKEAFAALYNEFVKPVYFQVSNIVQDKQAVEDIVSDVFLTALDKIGDLREAEAFPAWLGKIAVNKSANYLRDNSESNRVAIEAVDIDDFEEIDPKLIPDKAIENADTVRIVYEIVQELPLQQRSCIYFFYYEGLKVSEIAEALALSDGTVKAHLSQARAKIREELEKRGDKESLRLWMATPIMLVPILKFVFQSTQVPANIANGAMSALGIGAQTAGTAAGTATAASATSTASGATTASATVATTGTATGTATTATATIGAGKIIAASVAGVAIAAGVITGSVLMGREDDSLGVTNEPPATITITPSPMPAPATDPDDERRMIFLRKLLDRYETGGISSICNEIDKDSFREFADEIAVGDSIIYTDESGEYGIGIYVIDETVYSYIPYDGRFLYIGGYNEGKRSDYGIWVSCITEPANPDVEWDHSKLQRYIFSGTWSNDMPNGEGEAEYLTYDNLTHIVNITGVLIDGLWDGDVTRVFYPYGMEEFVSTSIINFKNGHATIIESFYWPNWDVLSHWVGINTAGDENSYNFSLSDEKAVRTYGIIGFSEGYDLGWSS